MWTCHKCLNENEENFRFCWSCGLTRPKPEIVSKPPEPPPQPVKKEIVKEEPKPRTIHPIADESDVLPMFARVSGIGHSRAQTDEDSSLERKIFTIAVRLVGLFLLYQVLIAVPDSAVTIYSALSDETAGGAANLFTREFVIPAAKLLFYFIVGIYLIASGRILLWLLPGR